MKAITSSIPDFEKHINGGYLYVDKTEYIWQLINPAGESYLVDNSAVFWTSRTFGSSVTILRTLQKEPNTFLLDGVRRIVEESNLKVNIGVRSVEAFRARQNIVKLAEKTAAEIRMTVKSRSGKSPRNG